MIESFRDKRTASLFAGWQVKGIHPNVQDRAREKLMLLDKARTLADLRVPPGNRLETLFGNRKGQWSIRVNDQWRLCFSGKTGPFGMSNWLTIIRRKTP